MGFLDIRLSTFIVFFLRLSFYTKITNVEHYLPVLKTLATDIVQVCERIDALRKRLAALKEFEQMLSIDTVRRRNLRGFLGMPSDVMKSAMDGRSPQVPYPPFVAIWDVRRLFKGSCPALNA
ncbi:unnamed protein product [Haemonchus placei]|uniref:WASH_WAHD domain-containing protein n=1 Tax=Haemonchus placei TaxID=6290 RepID=A0A0N4WHN4_HAEPC|nr:unnamed protein product [Haemonchus placei]